MLSATRFEEEGFVRVPGGSVWYGVAGARKGVPLLVVHGGPGTPHDYLEVLASLSDQRPVVFYDQLGCGRSERVDDPDLWRLPRFVDELRSVARAVAPGRVHVLGHSFGTIVTCSHALGAPRDVASLTLASPCLDVPRLTADIRELLRELPGGIRAIIARYHEGAVDPRVYRAACMAFFQQHVCREFPLPAPLERAFSTRNEGTHRAMWGESEFSVTGNLRRFDCTDRLGELAMPALLLCGRFDECTPDATRRLQERWPGAELAIFEDSAHFLSVEEPERFVDVVRGFLQRVEREEIVAP